jgi:hypothetical protein
MRLSTWMNPLPGDAPDVADRLVALKCAMSLTPDSVVASGASQAGDVTSLARKFEDWLGEATDDQDKHVRRAVLVMVCDKADETTSVSRIRALMKELHHYVTRH